MLHYSQIPEFKKLGFERVLKGTLFLDSSLQIQVKSLFPLFCGCILRQYVWCLFGARQLAFEVKLHSLCGVASILRDY